MNKKILFWIDLFTLNFGLAYYLQKQFEYDFFAIIDTTNKPKSFFQTQRLVKFKKSWFYHDQINKNHQHPDVKFLTSFEKKYNINLWQLAINDRLFYRFNDFHKFSRDEILSILEQECKFYENVLDEINPDLIIMQQPPLRHSFLFYKLCNSRGIRIIMTNQSVIGYKCFLSQNPNKLDSIDQLSNIQTSNRSFEDLQQYKKSLNYSQQITDYVTSFADSKIDKLKAAIDFLLFSDNKNINTNYLYYGRTKLRVLLHEINISLKRKYRKSFIDKNLTKKIDSDEPFVYFPLQVEPERNLLIGAPTFTNQIESIRTVAKSLPMGFKLFVKEHPAQNRTWRKISTYKEIMNIPNVLLIHPDVPSEKLYKNCSLVITIIGTSPFEAAFYGKPSIVFGDVVYSSLPSVFRVNNFDELQKIIQKSLQCKVNASDLDKFITFLDQNSFDFDFFGYFTKQAKIFFYGSNLINVKFSESKMKSFLDENESLFDVIVNEHVKKIKEIIHVVSKNLK